MSGVVLQELYPLFSGNRDQYVYVNDVDPGDEHFHHSLFRWGFDNADAVVAPERPEGAYLDALLLQF